MNGSWELNQKESYSMDEGHLGSWSIFIANLTSWVT